MQRQLMPLKYNLKNKTLNLLMNMSMDLKVKLVNVLYSRWSTLSSREQENAESVIGLSLEREKV